MNLLKQILSPYFGMVKTDFRPLEYIEIETQKPLIIKLNEKWLFKCELQKSINFIIFNDNKDIILKQLEKFSEFTGLQADAGKVLSIRTLIRLLYEVSKSNYKSARKKRKYYKFLNKYLFDNYDILLDVFTKTIRYNSELKKKQEVLKNIEIFGESISDLTAGGQQLRDLIVINPVTGEKCFKH